jgi:hypothetical protein
MIHRLCNPWRISNSGEKETDKQLSVQAGSEELFYVIYQMRLSSRYHKTQMAGECDFVVLTGLGIMVIEVKGGIIGYGKQPDGETGYYRLLRERTREIIDNPLLQVDGNSGAVKEYLSEKGLKYVFVGSMVCFPECVFEMEGIGEMRQLVKGILTKLGNSKKHKKYDFLVIDEAQDIFDKGIDHIVKALLKVNNPLQNGSYFIFYDDSQDYPEAGDLSHYIHTREIFKSYAASYTLISNLRVNTGHGINEFFESAASGTVDILKEYGEDVIIRERKKTEEVISLIKQMVIHEKALGSLHSVNTMVLFTADLLKESYAFPGLLQKDGNIELMLTKDYSVQSEKYGIQQS